VLGLNPGRDRHEVRERLGVQLQDAELPARLRVGEALRLYSSFYAAPADWRALLETLGLTGQQKTQFGRLSGGQRQRLSIALALVGQPEVVVLDELTTGLDPQARRDTWTLIEGVRDRGTTIVLVTHFMEEAERLCDRVAVFDSGRIVALDTPAALAALAAGADAGQRIMFRPDQPLDEAELLALPEVGGVQRRGDQVTVTGTGTMLNAVTTLLARRGIVARQLRVDQASLEDAFIALTGRPHDGTTTHAKEKSDVR
jgi:ABC-2 type transport system ATP-binding protein